MTPFLGTPIRQHGYRGGRISENYCPAGLRLGPQVHEGAFFCLVLTGELAEQYGSRLAGYHAGSVVFHPPGEEHSVVILTDTHCVTMEVDAPVLERLSDITEARRLSTDRGPLLWNAMRIFDEVRCWSVSSPLRAEGIVLEMLGDVASARESGDRARPAWLDLAEEILRRNFASHLTIGELAASVHVHPVHLTRTFRALHGCSVHEYRQRLRIDAACRRLAETPSPSLAELALDVGFSDQTHFSRVFKQITGLSPGVFRTSLHRC